MHGMVARDGRFEWQELTEPRPETGQVLVRTLACGICGTDLHARRHLNSFLAGLEKAGMPLATDPNASLVFGHEFCGEILEYGPDTPHRFPTGARVVGLPFLTGPRGAEYVGYSDQYPGGFAERMVLTERLLFEVPDGLSSTHAALVEPLSVGTHAVARAELTGQEVAMVIGCGPIGLAVVAALKARGLGPVIGMDFSPGRRQFAEMMGADEVVDPAREAQGSVWSRYATRNARRRMAAFECVGRPGVAQQVLDEIPRNSIAVIVGNSLEQCYLDQVVAFNKELDIRFSLNYSKAEFGRTLEDLAEGRIAANKLVTDVIPPRNVPDAFDTLAENPAHQAKVVVSFSD